MHPKLFSQYPLVKVLLLQLREEQLRLSLIPEGSESRGHLRYVLTTHAVVLLHVAEHLWRVVTRSLPWKLLGGHFLLTRGHFDWYEVMLWVQQMAGIVG